MESIAVMIAACAFAVLCVGLLILLIPLVKKVIITLTKLDSTIDNATETLERLNTELDHIENVSKNMRDSFHEGSQTFRKYLRVVDKPLEAISSGLDAVFELTGLKGKGPGPKAAAWTGRNFRTLARVCKFGYHRLRKSGKRKHK